MGLKTKPLICKDMFLGIIPLLSLSKWALLSKDLTGIVRKKELFK